jgi:hypothetical protein
MVPVGTSKTRCEPTASSTTPAMPRPAVIGPCCPHHCANSTADRPHVSETGLSKMKIDELREHARKLGIDGADELHRPEMLAKVKDHHYAEAHSGRHRAG